MFQCERVEKNSLLQSQARTEAHFQKCRPYIHYKCCPLEITLESNICLLYNVNNDKVSAIVLLSLLTAVLSHCSLNVARCI